MWQEYLFPTSVEEALDLLAAWNGRARLIAGGTDLVMEFGAGRRQAACLVDVTRIPSLGRIERQGEWIVIGATATFRQLKADRLVQAHGQVLAEAAGCVGAWQIQTMATLAGNVVQAMPAADGSVALLALGAEAEVAEATGRAWRPLPNLFLGPGRSAVDSRRQMITRFRFRALGPGEGSAWGRIGRRRALVLPVLNCGVALGLDEGGERITWARISLGPVAPVPFCARQAEAFLDGRPASPETFAAAAEVADGEAQPRSSQLRASKEYRHQVLRVLVRDGLAQATNRARKQI